ncbi:Putative DNA-binding domain-containing protein [Yoonia tamlensis]|uniref:Putative DNA-binding domain-containing protein n=1 Tax=Yoonia tamlensis TaxID=390270 RepID=A0A1I6FZ99_9RHOB|nr:DNA-binding domain-containing protein [Yoonia tamlensis]SFR35285.1 Putative DNA-binding domain-containing protein [Yoonia tamlensis]
MNVTQAAFRAGLFDPELPAPNGLQNPDGAQASKRFDVYRNNVAVGLSDALEAAFPVIRKLVGDNFFRAMAGVYLRKHPPKSPLMMFYGQAMPQFLRRFGPAQSLPYLPDIALLELAMRRAYHAADAGSVDPQSLGALAPDALLASRLRFAPAVQVLKSGYPIHAIYRANTTADAPKPVMKPENVLITRAGFDPQIHLLDQAATTCIAALKDGATLGETLVDDRLDLGATLALLLGQSAITSIY